MKQICLILFFSTLFFPIYFYAQDNATNDIAQSESASSEVTYTDSEERPWTLSNDTNLTAPQTASTGRKIVNAIKNILFFVIVIFLLYLLFRFLKRVGGVATDNGDLINVISTRQLASNRFLHVVKLGGEYYLVGSSDGGVNLLKEIKDKDLLDQLQLYKEKNAAPSKLSFIDMFRNMTKSNKANQTIGEKSLETIKNLKSRVDKLKKM